MNKSTYKFTTDWFEYNRDNWQVLFNTLIDQENHILEIGSYEGASTTWLLDNLATHPKSTVHAIDLFGGKTFNDVLQTKRPLPRQIEETFYANVRKSHNYRKLEVIKNFSQEALNSMGEEFDNFFNFIYIDGSHLAKDVLADAIHCWPRLGVGGIMVFDDYRWDKYLDGFDTPQPAVDAFLVVFESEIDVLHKDYQVIIKKKVREVPFRKNATFNG